MSHYYRKKKFSKMTSVTKETLRHYEKIKLLVPAKKTAAGYRLYSEDDLVRLQQITILKFLGYGLEDIKTILSDAHFDLQTSFETQEKLLTKKGTAVKDTLWLLKQILTQMKESRTVNWKITAQIITLLQADENDYANWQKHYYTESEYNELVQSKLRYTAEYWEDSLVRWERLFKEVESQLHTDPKSDIGMFLAKKWLDMKNEVQMSPELQKKGWAAFQIGALPQQAFPYNPQVIDYITQATAHYKRSLIVPVVGA